MSDVGLLQCVLSFQDQHDAAAHLGCDVFMGKYRNTKGAQKLAIHLTTFIQDCHLATSVHIPWAKANLMTKWHIIGSGGYSFHEE